MRRLPKGWSPLAAFLLIGCLLGANAASAALTTRTIRGEPHVDLAEVAANLGMELQGSAAAGSLRLHSQWTRMDFRKDSRFFELNGIKVYLGQPVAALDGRLWIAERDRTHALQPILTPQLFAGAPRLHRIVLDAGHGGKDPGASNTALGLRERALTLDLAERLGAILRDRGYEVIFTRSDDRFLGLAERAALANQVRADLFISLHFNAAGSDTVEGVETYVFPPQHQPSTARSQAGKADQRAYPANRQDVWNLLAGFYVQRELATDLDTTDRGLKRARFAVLRDLECPGLLIEGGFVTHAREGRNIGSAAYRQKMAVAIAEGVLTYQNTLDRIGGVGP